MSRHSFADSGVAMEEDLNKKDNKSEYLRRLVKQDMKGEDASTVGLEAQIQTLEKQAQSFAEQEEMLQSRAEELRNTKQRIEGQQNRQLQQARESLAGVTKEPTNPAIQKWAEKTDMTPEQLCTELEDSS